MLSNCGSRLRFMRKVPRMKSSGGQWWIASARSRLACPAKRLETPERVRSLSRCTQSSEMLVQLLRMSLLHSLLLTLNAAGYSRRFAVSLRRTSLHKGTNALSS